MFLPRDAGQAGAFQAEGTGQSLDVGTRWTDAGSARWEGLIGLIQPELGAQCCESGQGEAAWGPRWRGLGCGRIYNNPEGLGQVEE